MASVNWYKMTTQRAGSMFVHMDSHARANHGHKNKDIDKTRTMQNYCIGTASYSESLERLKARTKSVDAVKPPKRVKKDRVTAVMLTYTCPPELTEKGQEKTFFDVMYQAIQAYFGTENCHGSFVHLDEIHDYIDAQTKTNRTSLTHAHTLISPCTEEYGINCKNFETRQRLKDFNNAICYVIKRVFGIEYNNGKGKNYDTVETLKAQTEALERERALHLER